MREYIRNRIIICIQIIALVIISLFLLRKESFSLSTLSVAMNNNLDKYVDEETLREYQNQLYENGLYSPIYTFTGELTGYAGDCPLCSGYLACPPRTNVLENGIYFDDETYGTVRIVASSKNYPCGTILQFDVGKLSSEPIIAIVLDRGVSGNVIDLLTESEEFATKKVGRVRNLKFEVLREGWG
jgi:hypothetical protein